MKVLIAGLAKTGTTALLYLIANSIGEETNVLMEPNECPADLESAGGHIVAKILIRPALKAGSFSRFDKKITLVRDPRDRIISELLYSQYHAEYIFDDDQVRLVVDILKQKEADPPSVSLRDIRATMMGAASGLKKQVNIDREHVRRSVHWISWLDDYIRTIPDGFLYKYEDFVSEKYRALEEHLGILMKGTATVPKNVERVARTKTFGGWRHWFTEEDVHDYQPILAPWLKRYGYDSENWTLASEPVIPAEHCSAYFIRLVEEQRQLKPGNSELA